MANCQICATRNIVVEDANLLTQAGLYNCPRCGRYWKEPGDAQLVRPDVTAPNDLTLEQGVLVSALIRRYNDDNDGKPYPLDQIKNWRENIKFLIPPRDVLEQTDLLLEILSTKTKWFGQLTEEEKSEVWLARLYMDIGADIYPLFVAINEMGLISSDRAMNVMAGANLYELSLTLDGWKRIKEIKNDSKKSDQAFVAMWFDKSMEGVYDKGISLALEASGYKPYIVNRAHFGERIDHEIMSQIRKSSLVIAEMTGQRQNVYYEVGFAQGLGIPVIWCCKKPDLGDLQLHFDTRQYPHLIWETPEELKNGLVSHINGRGLNRK